MVVKGLECPECKQFVFSRAHHDMRSCKCGGVAVDGGRTYFRIMVKPEVAGRELCYESWVDATEQELFDDWNEGTNLFGAIDKE